MPLPAPGSAWPPPHSSRRYARFPVLAAWLAGDPALLGTAYGARVTTTVSGGPGTTLNPNGGMAKRIGAAIRNEFWTQTVTEEIDTRRHLGVAQEIATLSSEALYSEPLRIRVMGPVDGEGQPTQETRAAQARLDHVLARCNFQSTLLAAAEIGSALGSYGLRIVFDKALIPDRPVITRGDADSIVPVYSFGQLTAVMFWQQVRVEDGGVVWRHIEMHEQGRVFHGLYRGTTESLGERRSLAELPVTAGLADLVDAEGGITILAAAKTATSIPNMLPDPLDRSSYAGRSDFTPAVLDLFDAADRIYSQMMDAVDDARSRLIIAESMLERNGTGKGLSFDPNQRIFTKVKVPPADKEGGGLPIEKVQFEMHAEEYLRLLSAVVARAIQESGLSPQTDSTPENRDVTATEINRDGKRTLSTRDKKIQYAQHELSDLLTSLLAIDVQEFSPTVDLPAIPASADGKTGAVDAATGVTVRAFRVEVTFPDAVQPSINELAVTAKLLKDAGIDDATELVRTIHPDWSERQVSELAGRIEAKTRVVDANTFGLGGSGL